MTDGRSGLEPGAYEPCDVAWEEYERVVARLFAGQKPALTNLRVQHREVVQGQDGQYVIDTTIRYEALGVNFLVLVEAKLHKNPIKRADVQVLYQKVQSTGAHKGIFVASSPFQKGAREFARVHGIALIQLVDGALMMQLKSQRPPVVPRVRSGIGIAALEVYATDRGHGCRNLTAALEYVRDLLPSSSWGDGGAAAAQT